MDHYHINRLARLGVHYLDEAILSALWDEYHRHYHEEDYDARLTPDQIRDFINISDRIVLSRLSNLLEQGKIVEKLVRRSEHTKRKTRAYRLRKRTYFEMGGRF